MPLLKDASDESRSKNIAEMIKSGHDPEQAAAAAYRIQREAHREHGVEIRHDDPDGDLTKLATAAGLHIPPAALGSLDRLKKTLRLTLGGKLAASGIRVVDAADPASQE